MSDLPGLPRKDDEPGHMALPMMRGFACPVQTPMLGDSAPNEGIGVGWANTPEGPQFFMTIIADGGFAMTARLDYARYERLCHNLASLGQQAFLSGNHSETVETKRAPKGGE